MPANGTVFKSEWVWDLFSDESQLKECFVLCDAGGGTVVSCVLCSSNSGFSSGELGCCRLQSQTT